MIKRKVYAYITYGCLLLFFRHVDYPEAGVQVPGGTVESGESFEAALRREVREETGLERLELVGLVGEQRRDMSDYGVNDIQHQRFYHLESVEIPPESWLHTEEHASDGSGPLVIEYAWVEMEDLPELVGAQGDFVGRLKQNE